MRAISNILILSLSGGVTLNSCQSGKRKENPNPHPNILIAISDDQSFAHTSFAGCKFVNTPGFDRIAEAGFISQIVLQDLPDRRHREVRLSQAGITGKMNQASACIGLAEKIYSFC